LTTDFHPWLRGGLRGFSIIKQPVSENAFAAAGPSLGYNGLFAWPGEKFPVMKSIVSICVLALGIAGWAYAGHSYEK
jgi:hypothetical protein